MQVYNVLRAARRTQKNRQKLAIFPYSILQIQQKHSRLYFWYHPLFNYPVHMFILEVIIMADLCNRGPLYFCPVVSSFFRSSFFFSSSNRWKCRTQKLPSGHHRTTLSGYIFAIKAHIDNRKKFVKQQCIPHMCYDTVNFGLLAAEICRRVWDTPANFNGFRVLAALLRGTLVVGVSQTLRLWTEDATYIRHGGHHVGHWPTFLVFW